MLSCGGEGERSGTSKLDFLENQIFCMKDHIVFAVFEDGGVAFNLDNRASHILNRTGAKVLGLLDGKRDLGELIRTAARMFVQPEARIERDITDFLSGLVERGWAYVK